MFNKFNILLLKAFGNSGPFYASVRKIDSNVEDSIFTIGALLTPEMKIRIYYARINDNNSPVVYDWSSRAPGNKGSRGLNFVVPGAAVLNIPHF
uniref:Uncharacterized protein n=1 Tax=Panagrolaimus davidi TaxID=227884 RepID=A0A914PYF2_9BILA